MDAGPKEYVIELTFMADDDAAAMWVHERIFDLASDWAGETGIDLEGRVRESGRIHG